MKTNTYIYIHRLSSMPIQEGHGIEEKKRPIIISIEGNIGSGKSTLMTYLKQNYQYVNGGVLSVGYIDEPIETWNSIRDSATGENVIEKYYKDQHRYAFSFQMMAYISRLSNFRRAIAENKYDVLFTERSIYTDRNVFAQMLYDTGKIEDINFKIYLKWFDEFLDDIRDIKVVYIRTSPRIALQRVEQRNRQGEEIPLEYLTECSQYHDHWIDAMSSRDKLVIDGEGDNSHHMYYKNMENQITRFIITCKESEFDSNPNYSVSNMSFLVE